MAGWGRAVRFGKGVMLRTVRLAIVPLLLGSMAAWAGQLRFTNTPLDTGSLPRITEAQIGQKAQDAGPITLIVQFAGPIQPDDVRALEGAGATVHNYIPDYAYLVTAPAEVAAELGKVPGVTWAGLLPDYAKLSRRVADVLAKTGASKAAASTRSFIVLSADAYAAKALAAQGHRVKGLRKTAMGWYESRIDAPLAKAVDISSINSVFRVETVPDYELHGERGAQTAAGNLNAGGTAPTGPGYMTWLASKGLSGGNGIVVQVQDDGLDKGIATNVAGTAHADILGRITGIFNATSDPLGDSKDGHGQINAGIIMGNAALGTTDAAGFKLGQGLAPQATVYATKIFRNDLGPFDIGNHTFADLSRLAQNAGARFSSNSWGASVDGDYNSDSAEFDALVRDCDPLEAGNQPMIYFFSAGNDGPSDGTIGSPGTAKNVITVGAGENSDADGTDGCLVTPAQSNNVRDLVDFSSRGPTDDSRFGITLIAVGTHVQGPASTVTGYNGFGVCDQYWPAGQTNYARSSGTSHSCPIACGAGMIVHELFSEQLASKAVPANPSPAMMRAVLTNTATSMTGGSDGNGGTIAHVPNHRQGWGAVNLGNLIAFRDSLYISDQEVLFTASGQTHEVLLTRVDPSKPIKITLTWTDAPGIPGTVALVNNLNLEVDDDGTLYRGNVFSNGFSTAGGAADNRNTIEAVYLNDAGAGPMTVRVRAFNIAGNGVPNIGGALDQDFALFATNATNQTFAGSVSITPAVVSCDDTVTVTVSDADLRGDGTTAVVVTTSAGDSELVTLQETDAASGVFIATVDTRSGTPAANGKLEVANGGTITASYNDANNGTGQPAQVQDSSTVDCAAPAISNVQVSNTFSNQATVTFTTNELATSAIRFGASCGALSQSRQSPGQSTQHEFTLTGLTPNTQYFFVADATDTSGNLATANNGSCFSFTTTDLPDFFTEWFSDTVNDVDLQTLTFTPDASASGYSVCRAPATLFPTNPGTGTILNLADDDFVQVTLTGGKTVVLYGVAYSSFFVGSNGNISFGEGSTDFTESFDLHFAQPRISPLFNDFVPNQQHPVRFQQLSDRAVVSWVAVPEFATGGANSFQVEMFFDGVLRMTHLNCSSTDGLIGLSKGLGTPPDLVESDMSAYALCDQDFTISGTVTEIGAGAVAGVTLNGLPGPPVTDANGFYTVTISGGFTGTVTPQKSGYTFSPKTRSYNNVSADQANQNFTSSRGQLSVTPLSHSVSAGSGEVEFTISNIASGTFNWDALVLTGTSWARIVSASTGTNSGTIRVAHDANTTSSQRTATIRVSALAALGSPIDVSITQAPASGLSVTPASRNVGNAAGATLFNVSNPGGGTTNWSAQITAGGEWLEITSGNSGANAGAINLQFSKNSGALRTGTVRITSDAVANPQVDVNVIQAAAPDLVVTPDHRDVEAGVGTTTFNVAVTGGSGVAWNAEVVSGNWLGITSDTGGTDAGQIELSFGSNSNAETRSATIRFTSGDAKNAPVDVTVMQSAFAKLRVLQPNGGEVLQKGKKYKIKWQSQGSVPGTIRLDLFKNGVFDQTIKQGLVNDGSQKWRVNKVKKGAGYQVRVVSEANGSLADLSDSTFQIVK